MYSEPDSKNPVAIAQNAIQEAKAKGNDLVIVDTAGRLAVDEQMMNEIAAIKKRHQSGRDLVRSGFNDRSGCREYR